MTCRWTLNYSKTDGPWLPLLLTLLRQTGRPVQSDLCECYNKQNLNSARLCVRMSLLKGELEDYDWLSADRKSRHVLRQIAPIREKSRGVDVLDTTSITVPTTATANNIQVFSRIIIMYLGFGLILCTISTENHIISVLQKRLLIDRDARRSVGHLRMGNVLLLDWYI